MDNSHVIIVILSIIILILSIIILKGTNNEYFQDCTYTGPGGSANCNTSGCTQIGYACRTWCGLNGCLNG